jgi:formate transporter
MTNQPELANDERGLDALLPPQMAQRAEEVGVLKAALPFGRLLLLAVLAGAFIALGGVFSTTAVAGATGQLPYGVTRILGGVTFSLGLVLVIVGGAELFTGNNLIVMAWASGRVTTAGLLRNWCIVYLGNLVGALGTVLLVYASGQYLLGNGLVGLTALTIAESKCSLSFLQAVASGILCNALVCLALWLTFSARTTTDRILAIVACGFEHSVANMYFIPLGLLIKASAPESFWQLVELGPGSLPNLSWQAGLFKNLLPVTLGNILGGSFLVGSVYWFVYLRKPEKARRRH